MCDANIRVNYNSDGDEIQKLFQCDDVDVEHKLSQELGLRGYILLLQLLQHVPTNFKHHRVVYIRWVK